MKALYHTLLVHHIPGRADGEDTKQGSHALQSLHLL